MASYTPNLNLYKPDSTDDFEDFREGFNDNMDILDQGGGGGGSNVWIGTQAEYESATIADGTLVAITDDEVDIVQAESEVF